MNILQLLNTILNKLIYFMDTDWTDSEIELLQEDFNRTQAFCKKALSGNCGLLKKQLRIHTSKLWKAIHTLRENNSSAIAELAFNLANTIHTVVDIIRGKQIFVEENYNIHALIALQRYYEHVENEKEHERVVEELTEILSN